MRETWREVVLRRVKCNERCNGLPHAALYCPVREQVIKLLFRLCRLLCTGADVTRRTPESNLESSGEEDCRRMSEYIRPQGLICYKPYVFACLCTHTYTHTSFSYVHHRVRVCVRRALSCGRSRLNFDRIIIGITFVNLLAGGSLSRRYMRMAVSERLSEGFLFNYLLTTTHTKMSVYFTRSAVRRMRVCKSEGSHRERNGGASKGGVKG